MFIDRLIETQHRSITVLMIGMATAFVIGLTLDTIEIEQSAWQQAETDQAGITLFPIQFSPTLMLVAIILSLGVYQGRENRADRIALGLPEILSAKYSWLFFTAGLFVYIGFQDFLVKMTWEFYGLNQFGWRDAVLRRFRLDLFQVIAGNLLHVLAVAAMTDFFTMLVAHSRNMNTYAERVPIDLLRLDDHFPVSNAPLRFIVGIAIVLAIGPIWSLIEMGRIVEFVYWSTGLMLAVSLPVVLVLMRPMFRLRSRCQAARTAALDALIQKGETTADALTFRMFIESRSDWPIASEQRRMMLILLLPPITWVLAAVVENSIY